MKKPFVLVIIPLLVCLLLLGCEKPPSTENSSSGVASASITATPEPAPVETELVQSGLISEYLETTSNIYANTEVVVYPKLPGQVDRVLVEEGDQVKKGQVLAILDDDEYALKVRQAEVNKNQAQEKADRLKNMYEGKMVSQESYNDAMYVLEESKVAYELARLDFANTRVKSPIQGIVTNRSIQIGDLISNTTAAFEVLNPQSLMVDVYLPERETARLESGMTAAVLPVSMPEVKINALVKRINPTVDPQTGTQKVTLAFDGDIDKLTAGMYVRVQILLRSRSNAVLLPKRALIRRKDESMVFVMYDGIAQQRRVTLGLEDLKAFEVVTGLEPGEELIVVGQHTLENGQPVQDLADNNPSEETEPTKVESENAEQENTESKALEPESTGNSA